MNELIEKEEVKIESMIYEVRGKLYQHQQVMLDSDLGRLYNVETKRINEAVKNNIDKFPERFAFRISESEYNLLKSKISTSNGKGGSRKGHTVFTEQGVAMLATVLKSKVATNVSIAIMDAFVAMRKYISGNLLEQRYINNMVLEHDNKIDLILDRLNTKEKNNHIFFEGQIYDAYSLLLDIFDTAKKDIIILDNYADKKLLDILSKTNKDITIYSKNMNEELIKKYQSQYDNVTVKENDGFHDRFIIIDSKILYHCGSSFKDLGKKCFAISKLEDKEILTNILKFIGKL